MGLSIGQFVTTCHVPLRHRNEAELVDRIARGRLAADLAGRLGPSLSRQHAIVRIRLLPIRVIIPGPELNEESVSQAWTVAFTKALFTALSYPPGTGPFEVFQAESLSAFIASAIRDLLDEAALPKWQYAEFEPMLRMGSAAGALALLCEWPDQTRAILLDLAASGALDRMLARFDDLAFERLFTLLAGSADSEPPPLAIADLMALPASRWYTRRRKFRHCAAADIRFGCSSTECEPASRSVHPAPFSTACSRWPLWWTTGFFRYRAPPMLRDQDVCRSLPPKFWRQCGAPPRPIRPTAPFSNCTGSGTTSTLRSKDRYRWASRRSSVHLERLVRPVSPRRPARRLGWIRAWRS